MEFLLLGPLEVRHDGEQIELRGSKRRALLALLVLHANEVVRTDRLVDELWGEHPPANAAAALQNHVSRLRKSLGADVLVTKPWGYVLRADPQTIDLLRFEALVAEARPLAAHERRERLLEALALWRGPALADVAAEPALVSEVARLEELRLSALEQRVDTDLELGGEPELVAELETLVAKHPLRERLRGQLILALYRAGRQAEALEAYRETRRVLVEELGIEPSPELRELEQAILRQDPVLAVPPPAPSSPPPPDEPSSHWRWPRSPLAIAAALLLLLIAGGAAAALVVRAGGPDESEGAVPASSTHEDTTTSGTTAAERPIVITTVRKEEPAKPPARSGGGKPKLGATATTGVTTSREKPADPPPPPPQRPTTVTRTEPATTKTRTTTRQPADRDWVYWLTDDFEDPVFDSLMWRSGQVGDAISTAERNGRLEFSIDPQAAPQTGGFGADYTTQCTLSQDFDVRVEFHLLTWPPRNGLTVFLSPAFPGSTIWTNVSRKGAPRNGAEPERYSTGIYGYVPPEVPTVDTSGALRMTRVGKYITTYYRWRGQWVRLGSAYAAGIVRLVLAVAANAPEFGSQPALVAFDNFRAIAPDKQYSVECQGVPYPPRKPPP
jgi:DNA-binding SARP family transcriptional activator